MNIEKIIELIKAYQYLVELDIEDIFSELDSENIEEIEEKIKIAIDEYQMVYFANAIEILQAEDPSLQRSLGLASDLWHEITGVDSELLATLLIQNKMEEELGELIEELEDLLEE